jgi:hypothetical protein
VYLRVAVISLPRRSRELACTSSKSENVVKVSSTTELTTKRPSPLSMTPGTISATKLLLSMLAMASLIFSSTAGQLTEKNSKSAR